ncbi:cell surface protein [Listeria ivanovii]|uniref:DUF916 and DUF3324 domain-containing protein n=1 Tax=Listeria ivanovii TaxID=1638 RepID=UPI000DA73303|nr:DUF916 and DUF3324 domain-containing protein [Listeria ivanovii]PZG39258.1 cell surface protein [Listeria ivanovii]
MRTIITRVLLSCVLFIFLFPGNVFASEMNFSVDAVIPDNQINKEKSYFDLRMKPKQKQTLHLKFSNLSDKDVTVETTINPAITNVNGVVEYSENSPKLDKTLTYNIQRLTKLAPEVKLKAKETMTVPFEVTMPEESWDGILLGGIYMKQKESELKEKKDTQIENKYSYVIGLQLSETEKVIKPEMELLDVFPGQSNYRNVVYSKLQNKTAIIIRDLKVDGKVYKKNSDKVLHETKKENMAMAPNSNFDYAINWGNKELKPGTYRLEMTADSGENHWEWKKEFVITGETAAKLNEQAVNLEKDSTWIYVLIGSIVLVTLLVFVFLLGRQTKTKKQNKE